MNTVEEFIFTHFEPQIEELGFCFADVEYVKQKDTQYLRLFIDTLDVTKKVDITDCEKVSRFLDGKLDNEMPMLKNEYILEVSSPGIERPLKRLKDYVKFTGNLVTIKLYKPINGSKTFIGEISEVNENNISIKVNEEILSISLDEIAKANLYFEF